MAEPCAGEGVELDWRLHLKQNRSAIDQADRLGVDGPRGSGSGERSKENCYDYGASAEKPGLAPSPRCAWPVHVAAEAGSAARQIGMTPERVRSLLDSLPGRASLARGKLWRDSQGG